MSKDMNDTTFKFEPKYLDFNSLKELPESHVWDPSPSVDIKCPVPVVDLDDENALELIGNACKNYGIFQVVNHNIREGLLDEIEEAVKALFALPMEQKLKAAQSRESAPGYGLPIVAFLNHKLPWIEGFLIVGSPLEHARKLWPTDYQRFCDLSDEYQKEMKTLAMRMARLMLRALGISDEEWERLKGDFEGGSSAIQLNSYPPCPDPDRAMGMAAHTDGSFLTILNQNLSGLEIHLEGVGWVSVPLVQGSLTVNIGDFFHILSNGLYTSVFHRSVVNRTNHRVSMASFHGPGLSAKVSPLPTLVDQFHPLLYNPVVLSEYRDLRKKYSNNTLAKIRICSPGNEYVDGNNNSNSVHDE